MSTKIAVLPYADLKDGEMKEVGFGEDGKVLLSRLGDKVHATSAFCTHYGAPLAKGVLTADGRVVCPWHGACFNVCSGDIEDAPAPSALHSFQVEIADDQIYVSAPQKSTLKANMSRSPIKSQSTPQSGNGVVIVGGGAGAFHAVDSLRENGYRKPITIVSSEPYAPIDRTKLSKALITEASKLEWQPPAVLKDTFGVTLLTDTSVTKVDPKEKHVLLDSGERISYEAVIFAPGATARRLPGTADFKNVFTLRSVQDAQRIDAALKEGKRLVVIGSSFISMEIVVAVTKRKLGSIDVVAMEEYPFEAVLGAEVGKGLKKYHEGNGVKFHPSAKVAKVHAASSDSTHAESVELENGTVLSADVIVLGIGVQPATGFLKESGFTLEKDGGIKVDQALRVEGFLDVYAIGDIACYPQSPTGQMRRIEHWNVASNHGRAVGRSIASGNTENFEKVPIFWSAQGSQLRYCGIGAGFDDVFIRGNPADLKFTAYYGKNNRVVAVATMGADPLVSKCSELIRLELMPSMADLRAGKNPLEIDTSTKAALPKLK